MFYAILVLCSAEDGINTTKGIKGKKKKKRYTTEESKASNFYHINDCLGLDYTSKKSWLPIFKIKSLLFTPPEVTKENCKINRILFLPQIEVVTLSYLTP